jgi:hypothetical protein
MNEAVVVALIVSIAPTLVAVGSIIVSIRNSRQQNEKLVEIHRLTNDSFSKAMAKINQLEEIISHKRDEELARAKRRV